MENRPIHDEAHEEFTYEELQEMFQEAENEEPYVPFWQSSIVKKFLAGLIALMLVGNVFAFMPKFFSLPAIQFLTVSAKLSNSEHIAAYKKAIVVVTTDGRKGTGFHISSERGMIVTNNHVVGDAETSAVSFPDGSRYTAKVTARDPDVDIAILEIGPNAHDTLELADPAVDVIGEPVYIIGNPLFSQWIANEGSVLELLKDRNPPLLAIQAPIYRGNSGSPVMNHEGQVIGVIFATTTIVRNGENQSIGLAVPIEWVWKYVY